MKMPFVVTMSVAASACGGSFIDSNKDAVETGGVGGDDPGGTGGGHETGGAGGWSNGGAVAAGGFVAAGGAIAAGGTFTTGGMWGYGGSVNPPYPYGCPVDAPVSGMSCYGTFPPAGCSYPGNAPCQSTRVFMCENGAWSENAVYIPTCNPPPPPPPACPPDEPTQGTSCLSPTGQYYTGPTCGYGNCYGSPSSFWKCVPIYEGGTLLDYVWSSSGVASCNPPGWPADAGGAAAADAGTAIPPNP